MPDHPELNEYLTKASFDAAIRETFIGQAHIAGTGPAGTTCRQCTHFHRWRRDKETGRDAIVPPGYYSKRHKESPLELKKAYCNRPILNKARRLIPHVAKSCRLFEKNPTPPPITKPET